MCELFLKQNVQLESRGELNLIKNDLPLVNYFSATVFQSVYVQLCRSNLLTLSSLVLRTRRMVSILQCCRNASVRGMTPWYSDHTKCKTRTNLVSDNVDHTHASTCMHNLNF